MATPSEDSLIKAIQDHQDKMMSQMDDSLKSVFKKLSNQVLALTDKLSLNPKERAQNLREMLKLKNDIADTIVNNKEYQKQVSELTNGFETLADLSNQYIGLILDSPIERNALYDAILETNIEITKDALLGAGIRDNFSNSIQEVLKTNITGTTNSPAVDVKRSV